MLSKDLKVINLNITEDFYDYKGTFKLCSQNKCILMNLEDVNGNSLVEVKKIFGLEEPVVEIKKEIMAKVMEAAKIESRNKEGKNIG